MPSRSASRNFCRESLSARPSASRSGLHRRIAADLAKTDRRFTRDPRSPGPSPGSSAARDHFESALSESARRDQLPHAGARIADQRGPSLSSVTILASTDGSNAGLPSSRCTLDRCPRRYSAITPSNAELSWRTASAQAICGLSESFASANAWSSAGLAESASGLPNSRSACAAVPRTR